MKNLRMIFLLILIPLIGSCANPIKKAVNNVKYSAYEAIGMEKRDLFKKEVKNVKKDQEQTGESFKDALEELKAIYGFDGGKLERQYKKLNSSYEDAEKRANEVHASVARLSTVATDLFTEWRKEIGEMDSADLRAKSMASLGETEKKYESFFKSLKKSEAKMDPVLRKLKDQVIFMKHNLNAQAITGLKNESAKIEGDIDALIKDMNSSIAQGDDIINSL
ncbi:MAG: DUF2959 family protein [Bdellovibrionota bacterium]